MSTAALLTSSLGALTTPSLPAANPATEPANIRRGGAKAQQAYATALEFEQVLVNELTQQLTASSGLGGDGSDGGYSSLDGSSSSSLGSDPAASQYAQMLPGTLASSVMSAGGLGNLADTLAAAIDPAINSSPATPAGISATTATAAPGGGAPSGGAAA